MNEADARTGFGISGLLWWHEIINDRIESATISVTFCPLTGSGLVFDTTVPRDHLIMMPVVESTWH